ncbi:unnamed protein product [Caretta caretta]
MDYKVIAKAISLRLWSMMVDVVHPDQTNTVPGQTIFDNLYLVRDLLELGPRDGLSFALLSLDQEKAFDRVDHGYLLGTLKAFGFGPQFMGFLHMLCMLMRSIWSGSTGLRAGITAGVPPLGPAVCSGDRALPPSPPPDVDGDPDDLVQVEACQAVYSAASSAWVNWVKSSGLVVGDGWQLANSTAKTKPFYISASSVSSTIGSKCKERLHFSATNPEVFLQETHTDPAAEDKWRLEWGDGVYFSHFATWQAGVATLFSPNLRPEVLGVTEAVPGHLLHLQVRMEGLMVNLVNIYAPQMSSRQPQFYQRVSDFLGTLDSHECLVLGGDFNTTLEEQDCAGAEPSPAAANILQGIVEHHSLVDVWRDHHPDDTSMFTFVQVEAIGHTTLGWTVFTYPVSIFHRPTPPPFGRPHSPIII